MRTDGGTEMNVIVAFRNFAKAPKSSTYIYSYRVEAGDATVRHSYFPEVIQEITPPFKEV